MKIKFLWLVLIMILRIQAQDGILDSTFGINGIVLTEVGQFSGAYDLVIQENGKIIVGGYATVGMQNQFAIIRYESDGSLDTNFGSNGIVTTQMGVNGDAIKAIKIQSDGKIIAVGTKMGIYPDYDIALVRYNENGSLDNSFGTNGKVIINIAGNEDYGTDLALYQTEKIAVAGFSLVNNNYKMVVIRLNNNGSLDTTFDEDGISIIEFPEIGGQLAYKIALLQGEKILIAGHSYSAITSNNMFTSVRLLPTGRIDSSFADNGISRTDISEWGEECTSLAIYPNGAYILSGHFSNSFLYYDFVAVKYTPDGLLDTKFNSTGIKKIDIGSVNEFSFDCKIQNNMKILLGGYTWNSNTTEDFAFLRLNSDASLDTNLNSNGIVITDIDSQSNTIHAIELQSDGKILVGGISQSDSPMLTSKFTLARYTGSSGNVGIKDINQEQIASYYLLPNYPNPFNPSTKISWQVPVGSWQTIKIYDVLGKEIATLVDEYKPAGSYEVEWDASNYPSGVYFYQLKADSFIEIKKMILIK